MSPRHSGTDATRDRLLDAALAVHAGDGPDGFTMSAVIKASGASSGSLYHHFGSFDGLAAALYTRCMSRLLDALLAALEPQTDPRAGVEAVVRAYLRFTREQRDEARFVHASAAAAFLPAHAAAIAAAKRPRADRLAAWLRPHLAGAVSAPMAEMLVIGPAAETARRWLAGDPAIDLAEAETVLPPRVARSVLG
ncbi:TetR/AcrR family transcriptional regulator [Dactylosporangium sp. AC04546]|uniref:TetR/AcrR family transcriptional regulator n=1 Tax=Dactylosporangium sp. AC04546 TaxID=2862460 RepID=UPI001EE0DAD7|nr:TetR/AcrR family transcriptional regulator [Dactylosporangium sp. AC04546]WVK81163.1 TetR/AcrR family transcriptional regulator [Dactylosporangium sp. AC04546]